jgi:hypothetical protein
VVENAAIPSPADLLRAALEKIVFFEWRLSELAAELSAAQTRSAASEAARGRAEEAASAAEQRARSARMQTVELESDRARLAALLARPSHGTRDTAALEAERNRSAQLQALLDEANRELGRVSDERERWLNEMVAQARSSGEAPAALAQFISELRSEIIALRALNEEADRLLVQAGVTPPVLEEIAPKPMPQREPGPVEEARKLWAEGRLGPQHPVELAEARLPGPNPTPVPTTPFARPSSPPLAAAPASMPPLPSDAVPSDARQRRSGTAARALAEQCLRNLSARDPGRREQAARHLVALPIPAAAPALASALGIERDSKARAQLAKALLACGGEGAAEIVARLQFPTEPPLVRMAAAEALSAVPSRAREALQIAASDPAPAVRRRAAALAAAEGFTDLLARLENDEDASVRAATSAAQSEAPPPAPEKDPAHDALHAVQAAIFGLTDAELAEHIGVPESQAFALAAQLVAQGRLTRRGKRLVSAQGGAA